MLERIVGLFKNAGRVYLLVHLFLLVIRLRKSKTSKWRILLQSFKGWLKSCLFATGFATAIPSNGCIRPFKSQVPFANSNYGFLISFLFSWFILFESRSRWGEMSIYVLAQWFEGYGYSLRKRGIVTGDFSALPKILFAISFGIITNCYYGVRFG